GRGTPRYVACFCSFLGGRFGRVGYNRNWRSAREINLRENDIVKAEEPVPGLCARCAWSRVIVSDRGARFWMCRRGAEGDPRFPKYPRLPVMECAGFEPSEGASDA
ncbi:MAG: hypothetical protein JWO80_4035, partial [Bryobacterales bacterium]|nr:hypothetical protein [Bryobacterales bacterium]